MPSQFLVDFQKPRVAQLKQDSRIYLTRLGELLCAFLVTLGLQSRNPQEFSSRLVQHEAMLICFDAALKAARGEILAEHVCIVIHKATTAAVDAVE